MLVPFPAPTRLPNALCHVHYSTVPENVDSRHLHSQGLPVAGEKRHGAGGIQAYNRLEDVI